LYNHQWGRSGFLNSTSLGLGELCGEELFTWNFHPKSTSKFPSSTSSIENLVEVYAFALRIEYLNFVGNQFRGWHIKKPQHTSCYVFTKDGKIVVGC
jgi:cyclic nucleotide gated channel